MRVKIALVVLGIAACGLFSPMAEAVSAEAVPPRSVGVRLTVTTTHPATHAILLHGARAMPKSKEELEALGRSGVRLPLEEHQATFEGVAPGEYTVGLVWGGAPVWVVLRKVKIDTHDLQMMMDRDPTPVRFYRLNQ